MAEETAIRLHLRGRVQGVGFRPLVYRLARELHLRGWVCNDPAGAEVVLAGTAAAIRHFRSELLARLPAAAVVSSISEQAAPPDIPSGFEIRPSRGTGEKAALILPDLATCPECRREIQDPCNRRHRYPFTNCTQCGPRYSILLSLPYDRAHTTMRNFRMCADCEEEYRDPHHRRFHAQPNACSHCGPQLQWLAATGRTLALRDEALEAAAAALRAGAIVAVKGIGGFHLMVDARDGVAVRRLRQRKRRDEKPFAVMFPSRNAVGIVCELNAAEAEWLESAAAPIVLLNGREGARSLAPEVAPSLPWLGAFLPYTPLHHLLLDELGFPIVATSGNFSDEPICIDNDEALARLGTIADYFLCHDRPIARPLDDSVLAVCDGQPVMLRRGRGLAPYTRPLPAAADGLLAVGAQMKSTVAITVGGNAIIGPHVGDLEHEAAARRWKQSAEDLLALHDLRPTGVVADRHPHYVSSVEAAGWGVPVSRVQHHHAHVAACMAEHGLQGPVLGVAWDGTGLGTDGTIWGGEFLVCSRHEFQRAAWLRTFPLIGADAAAREPRRSAWGVLREIQFPRPPPGFSCSELEVLDGMFRAGVNVVRTSSAGRLFDAVAALLGVCLITTHEGQAAMRVEALAGREAAAPYPFQWRGSELDWQPMVTQLLTNADSPASAAARFHETLIAMIVAVARKIQLADVCLAGGCFQNRRLLGGALRRLREAGFRVWCPREVPPNDAGIAFGQLAGAGTGP